MPPANDDYRKRLAERKRLLARESQKRQREKAFSTPAPARFGVETDTKQDRVTDFGKPFESSLLTTNQAAKTIDRFAGQMARRYSINPIKSARDVVRDTISGDEGGLKTGPKWLWLVPGLGIGGAMVQYNLLGNEKVSDVAAPADLIGASGILRGVGRAATSKAGKAALGTIGAGLGFGAANEDEAQAAPVSTASKIARSTLKTTVRPEEILETARSYADEATSLANFSPSDLFKLAKTATDQATVSFNQAKALGKNVKPPSTEDISKARYVVNVGEQLRSWLDAAGSFDPRKTGITITQGDVPFDIRLLQRALAGGESAKLDLPVSIPTEDIGIQIAGETAATAARKGSKMFRSGAEAGFEIANAINPNFVGRFRTQDLTEKASTGLLDLLTEARGGIRPVTGTVFNRNTGEEIMPASQELWNANDHAIAKATEAARQAVEQRVASALNITLPEDFLDVRQAQLDFVNDPNRNNVIVDFIANSGKGGLSLDDLSSFLTKKLQSGKLRPHQRGAYEQMLGDVLSGKYKQINAEFKAIAKETDNPLKDVIDPKAMDYISKYVDDLRRNIRATNKPEYNNDVFIEDMNRLLRPLYELQQQELKQ